MVVAEHAELPWSRVSQTLAASGSVGMPLAPCSETEGAWTPSRGGSGLSAPALFLLGAPVLAGHRNPPPWKDQVFLLSFCLGGAWGLHGPCAILHGTHTALAVSPKVGLSHCCPPSPGICQHHPQCPTALGLLGSCPGSAAPLRSVVPSPLCLRALPVGSPGRVGGTWTGRTVARGL